jgi:hypothetical protein
MTACRIAGHFVTQDLERHFAAQTGIPGAIDLTHTAGVERSNDFVAANPLTGFVWHGVTPI